MQIPIVKGARSVRVARRAVGEGGDGACGSAAVRCPWIVVTPFSGAAMGELTMSVKIHKAEPGLRIGISFENIDSFAGPGALVRAIHPYGLATQAGYNVTPSTTNCLCGCC